MDERIERTIGRRRRMPRPKEHFLLARDPRGKTAAAVGPHRLAVTIPSDFNLPAAKVLIGNRQHDLGSIQRRSGFLRQLRQLKLLRRRAEEITAAIHPPVHVPLGKNDAVESVGDRRIQRHR